MTRLRATCRIQMRNGVDFDHLRQHLDYFRRLGASHLYLSPIFTARAGSTHGYDVTRPDEIDPALGGRAGFERLARAAQAQGLRIVLDIVPNHMAASTENPWWRDVLEHGRSSRYAHWFDIDWDTPPADGRIALPVLGGPYGDVLGRGELRLVTSSTGPELLCHDSRLPLRPETRAELAGRDLDALNADPLGALHPLLERQHYRLVYWRALPDHLNWRRFFDISELAGLRIERADVFEAVHALVFELVTAGLVHGLRVDHVDGLADPGAYLRTLRARVAACGAPEDFPVWVEKILGPDEALPPQWPVAGTTGYEVLNDILHLLCDGRATRSLDRLWRRVADDRRSFEEVVRAARGEMLTLLFAGEHRRIAELAAHCAARQVNTSDLGTLRLGRALTALLERFSVYRTYLAGTEPSPGDHDLLAAVCAEAAAAARGELDDALTFLRRLFGTVEDPSARDATRRFEQLSGPVAAKAVEDTAFYRHLRFVAVNEVGGEPGHIGLPPARFHARNAARARGHPATLVPTATHDTKRGADVRARLAVLSEMPRRWAAHIALWRRINRVARGTVDGAAEHLLYQTLVGAWPPALTVDDRVGLAAFADRIAAYMLKAAREAKRQTSWTAPDPAYEADLERFVRRLLDPDASPAFLADLHGLVERILPAGAVNGLVQQALAITVPGVPDIYCGAEMWDFSLVDPDNRRPVDLAASARALDASRDPAQLLPAWRDGRIKQWLVARLLALRAGRAELFAHGSCRPVAVRGAGARHVVAFERATGDARIVVAVVRFPFAAGVGRTDLVVDRERLEATSVLLPTAGAWSELVCGEALASDTRRLDATRLFRQLPVAVLAPG